MKSEALEIYDPVEYDNEITSWKVVSHTPFGSPEYGYNDEIRIGCWQQNVITHPASSQLVIEGRITAGGRAPVDKNVVFINNAMAFIFEEIRYTISGVQVDVTRNVGITSLLKNHCTLDHATSRSLAHTGWNPGYKEDMMLGADGSFKYCLPLSLVLGCMEDNQKILQGAHQELVLLRAGNDRNVLLAKKVGAPPAITPNISFTIHKISWRLPYLEVAEARKLRMLRAIEQDKAITMAFRSWELHEYPSLPLTDKHIWTVRSSSSVERARFIIVGFQDNRKGDVEKDNSLFDHCNVENVRVYLNSTYYPYENCLTNFKESSFSSLYEMYRKFRSSYYNDESPSAPGHMTPSYFLKSAPIHAIDCFNQPLDLKSGSVDIRLEINMRESVKTTGVSVYCLIIHDNVMEYSPLSGIVKRVN